jgi:hypothetical protein
MFETKFRPKAILIESIYFSHFITLYGCEILTLEQRDITAAKIEFM